MPLRAWLARSALQPGAPGLRALNVSREEWRPLAQDLAASGGRLVALWASANESGTPCVRAFFLANGAGILATLTLASDAVRPYPGLENLFPAAARMQRAIAD